MDKLVAMRCFVEIADRGSLTAAAEAIGRSLPTVVRTLAELERTLGVVLMRRTTRRLSLTEEGRIYLERSRRLLSDLEETEALLGSAHSIPQGHLRVTAPVLFGQMHVAPAVLDFLRAYRGVDVELLLLDRTVDLVEEGIDLAVRIAPLADSTMIATNVGAVRRIVCASPDLLDAVGTPARPEELSHSPCVRFTGISAGNVWRFREGQRERSVRVDGSFTTNQGAAAIGACVAGLGFGQFISYQVEPQLSDCTLRRVLADFEPPDVPVSLVYSEARMMSSRLRVFIDWMKPRLRGLSAL